MECRLDADLAGLRRRAARAAWRLGRLEERVSTLHSLTRSWLAEARLLLAAVASLAEGGGPEDPCLDDVLARLERLERAVDRLEGVLGRVRG